MLDKAVEDGVDSVGQTGDPSATELSLPAILAAYECIKTSELIVRTPLWRDCNKRFFHLTTALPISSLLKSFRLHMKMENAQIASSFKIRGVFNQISQKSSALRAAGSAPVTMSAGNYGKAFAYCLSKLEGIKPGMVVMPTLAPQERVDLIRGMGCQVQQVVIS